MNNFSQLVTHHCKKKNSAIFARRAVTISFDGGIPRQNGFTMVEAIIVIIITGIIGAAVAIFIRLPVQGYVDMVARAQLTDIADTALRRMARDIRLALPNSVRVSGKYLELLPTRAGGRYLAEEDNPTGAANILNFTSASLTFDIVGAPPAAPQNIVAGDYIVVYNLGGGQTPADAYDCTGPCNRARVAATPAGNTVTLSSNPFAAQPVKMKSPTMRFQVVTPPVTYFCNDFASGGNGRLLRYTGYAISGAQPTAATFAAAGITPATLATNVQSCIFSYTTLANTHSGLIGLTIALLGTTLNTGTVVLSHQVHVDNTP